MSTNGIYTAETQVIKKTEMSLLRFLCVQIPYKPKLYMNYTSTNDVHTTETCTSHKKKTVVYFMRFFYVQIPYEPKHMIPIADCIIISQNATKLPLHRSFQATNLTDVPECCIRTSSPPLPSNMKDKRKKAMVGLKGCVILGQNVADVA